MYQRLYQVRETKQLKTARVSKLHLDGPNRKEIANTISQLFHLSLTILTLVVRSTHKKGNVQYKYTTGPRKFMRFCIEVATVGKSIIGGFYSLRKK